MISDHSYGLYIYWFWGWGTGWFKRERERERANKGGFNRQTTQFAENLLRLGRQNRSLVRYIWSQVLPAVLVLENACLPSAGGLASLLRGVGAVVPSCADGVGEHPDLE